MASSQKRWQSWCHAPSTKRSLFMGNCIVSSCRQSAPAKNPANGLLWTLFSWKSHTVGPSWKSMASSQKRWQSWSHAPSMKWSSFTGMCTVTLMQPTCSSGRILWTVPCSWCYLITVSTGTIATCHTVYSSKHCFLQKVFCQSGFLDKMWWKLHAAAAAAAAAAGLYRRNHNLLCYGFLNRFVPGKRHVSVRCMALRS